MRVRTAVDPWLGSPQRIESRVWFGASDASALQRIRTRSGGNAYHKLYRFTRTGVYRSKTVPRRSEEGSTFESWTKKSESFYAYPPSARDCTSISEPSVLLDLISTRPPSPGDTPRELCVFNKKQLHRVRLVATGFERLRVDYTDLAQIPAPRRGEVEAVRVSLVATALPPAEREPEDFTFLELTGDIEILVDRDAGVPLRVRGSVPIFGSVDFVLREVIRDR